MVKITEQEFEQMPEKVREYFGDLKDNWISLENHVAEIFRLCEGDNENYQRSINYLEKIFEA